MDIQKIVTQLIKFLGQNPQLIGQFLNHPYSTTQQATGATNQLSATDMSQVITALAGLSSGQQVDYGNLAGIASQLMGSNGNSCHNLASTLFGGSQAQQQVAQATQSNSSLDLGSLVSLAGLATQLFGGMSNAAASANATATSNAAASAKPNKPHKREEAAAAAAAANAVKPTANTASSSTGKVDLSDGIDMGEAVTIASQLFGLGGKQ